VKLSTEDTEGTETGRKREADPEQGLPRKAKPKTHPLLILGMLRGFSHRELMNWLQGRGWISDNCVNIYDVALGDIRRVLAAASANLGRDFLTLCLSRRNPEAQCARPDWRYHYGQPWAL
jgi:hypothetical protein